jgi:hypothetical protein
MTAESRTKLDDLMDQIKQASTECDALPEDEFTDCVSEMVMKEINKITESKAVISSYRDMMAARLRDYLCGDETLKMSNSTSTTNYYDQFLKNYLSLVSLLDTPHAKVYYIEDFLTPQECSALQSFHKSKASAPKNHVSTVMYDLGPDGPADETIK